MSQADEEQPQIDKKNDLLNQIKQGQQLKKTNINYQVPITQQIVKSFQLGHWLNILNLSILTLWYMEKPNKSQI
ncbi:hypothetical protein M0812_05866 [Anaeramoeba flamelloides]|uniref:WH2 domain-containing protein n=1 Tax=Anaeramoeba flamelloides TaxID=1746091 RepID=A0AAV8A5W3_9EUKA|nr:hypothetical protein M0812_05866 [Anaeramoeba flamelloides]